MPESGVILSDGIEQDYLPFNAGCVASFEAAHRTYNDKFQER